MCISYSCNTLMRLTSYSENTHIYDVRGSIPVWLTSNSSGFGSVQGVYDSVALLQNISNIFTCVVEFNRVKQEVCCTVIFPLSIL